MTKFSYCIPHFNNAELLARCIKSIYEYSNDFEIVVVDDHSPKGSFREIESLAKKFGYGKIRILRNKKNMGVSFTKNKCFLSAMGRWCIFIDSDDYFHPTFGREMELQLDCAKDAIVLFHCLNNHDPKKRARVGRPVSYSEFLNRGTGEEALAAINREKVSHPPYIGQLRGYERLGILRLIEKAGATIYLSDVRPRYYTNDSNIQLSCGAGWMNRLDKTAKGHIIILRRYWRDLRLRTGVRIFLLASLYTVQYRLYRIQYQSFRFK